MLRIAQITDTHVTAPEFRLCGLHTPTLLRRALAEVGRQPAGFYDAVVMSGDLTHKGDAAAYAELQRCIADCPVPVHLMIGNHDDRQAFRATFGGEARYMAGDFVQYAVEDVDGHRLVMLDTNVPGTARGLLCEARLAWLDATLAARPETPTLLFLHHPPFATHIAPMDAIGLDGIDGLARVVARHPQVASIHAGHAHRTMTGRLGDVPVMAAASTCHQVALDFAADELVIGYEPPSFAMILADAGRVMCHTVFFTLAEGPRLSRHDGPDHLEVGPGQALGAWALQHPASGHAADPLVLASLRHAYDPA